ncbi:hypothetical protein E1N52_19940 [Paraburkholderia guartelaensis]|uniref:Uncharacterized protein n=1 Tax=Paraburkholderia guartelaensis TaxID=2546446 RepID=A0A4R5LDH0_9BURK|nr:hypothetical protein E1N52_19940 [Paraburkholderia guartelaensis]
MPTRNLTTDRPRTAPESDAIGKTAVDSESDATLVSNSGSRKGRSRRARFGDVTHETQPRAATGAIAISFAVVSRRHWPR